MLRHMINLTWLKPATRFSLITATLRVCNIVKYHFAVNLSLRRYTVHLTICCEIITKQTRIISHDCQMKLTCRSVGTVQSLYGFNGFKGNGIVLKMYTIPNICR
ncbi:hypothetical protein NP493_143g01023 [Ridgeia piscesae]|uniref:Uncharacterized protein n=1 Tax=Ridgeia piscesae TaxID=27915 RepID=A0AAD9UG26_RIDPI|nr:hypothetical protein NP493_143g01023 [Ridgeia piscesae]